MQNISGSFNRELGRAGTLYAEAQVGANEAGGVDLNVPRGPVQGSMSKDTAVKIGTALITEAGGTAPTAAASKPSTKGWALYQSDDKTGWYVEDADGNLVVEFIPPPPPAYFVAK